MYGRLTANSRCIHGAGVSFITTTTSALTNEGNPGEVKLMSAIHKFPQAAANTPRKSAQKQGSAAQDAGQTSADTDAVEVYCMTTLVAEEARRNGCDGFAKQLEQAMSDFLGTLTRGEQTQALLLSYELVMAASAPTAPQLRLVYSRD
jgi:hypothetical protein